MRRFLGSAWFPFLVALVLAGATAGGIVWLKPDPEIIGQSEIAKYTQYGAWAVGPVAGLVMLIVAGLLNLIRRIFRVRRVNLLHPVIVLVAIAPSLVFAWQITGENPYTPIARAIIEFGGRPLLLGSLIACVFTIVLSIPLLFPSKKK